MTEKLIRWFIFSVVAALLPIILNALRLAVRGLPVNPQSLSGRGELLLIAAAISTAAIGELVVSGPRMKIFKIISGGGSLVMLVLSSVFFADVSAGLLVSTPLRTELISKLSILAFFCSLCTSGSCIALAEV